MPGRRGDGKFRAAEKAGITRIVHISSIAASGFTSFSDESGLHESRIDVVVEGLYVLARVAALIEERKRLERDLADAKKALAMGGGSSSAAAGPEDIAGVAFSGQVLEGLDPKELRGLVDEAKGRLGEGIAALVAVNEGRASVAVGVTGGLNSRFSAVDLVKAAVTALGDPLYA